MDRNTNGKKRKSTGALVARIVILLLTIVVLVGVLLWGLGFGPFRSVISLGNWQYDHSERYAVGSGSVPAQGIDTIEVNWISGRVDVVVTDGDAIRFREPQGLDEADQLRYLVDGNRLILQFCASKWSFRFSPPNKTLTLEIPKSLADDMNTLELNLVSAGLQVDGITARECELETVSGTSRFSGCAFDHMEVDSVSGDLTYEGRLDTLEYDAVSGDVSLRLDNTPREIAMDQVSGDVDIYLPADAAFSATMDSASGDFTSLFPTVRQGDTYFCGSGGGVFQFDSASGDVTIQAIQ